MMIQSLRFAFAALLLLLVPPAFAKDFQPAEQVRIVLATADLIESRYVDAEKGAEIAARLRDTTDRWNAPLDGEVFAQSVTDYLRVLSQDGHLGLSFSAEQMPENGGEASFSAAEMARWYGPQINHGFYKIERLDGNIMLLDLRVFPPNDMAADLMVAAMTLVAQGDALIIDLRRNGGGAGTAGLMIPYLAEPGMPLSGTYDRPTDTRTYGSVAEWVPGRRFGSHKPLYILTSHRTFSAAEAVAYDLQAMGRAIIVGEVTGGGANPFEYRRVHPHFAVDLPESRSINPITGTNWQGVGVKPDVALPADEALAKAIELAHAAIGH